MNKKKTKTAEERSKRITFIHHKAICTEESVLVLRTKLHCSVAHSVTHYPGKLSTLHVPVQPPAIKDRSPADGGKKRQVQWMRTPAYSLHVLREFTIDESSQRWHVHTHTHPQAPAMAMAVWLGAAMLNNSPLSTVKSWRLPLWSEWKRRRAYQ